MTRRLFCRLALAAALAGCAPALHPLTPEPGTLFSDDFSDPLSGWDRHRAADIITDYDSGQYLIAVNQPGVDAWATPGLSFTDISLEVDAAPAGIAAGDEFGLMCRYRSSNGRASFYFFVVNSDGRAAAGKVLNNQRTVLAAAPQIPVSASPDHLAATCGGSSFEFVVNGSAALRFTDDQPLARGDVGLLAGAGDTGGGRVSFDNFSIRAP